MRLTNTAPVPASTAVAASAPSAADSSRLLGMSPFSRASLRRFADGGSFCSELDTVPSAEDFGEADAELQHGIERAGEQRHRRRCDPADQHQADQQLEWAADD